MRPIFPTLTLAGCVIVLAFSNLMLNRSSRGLVNASTDLAAACYKEGVAVGRLLAAIEQMDAAGLPVPKADRVLTTPTKGCAAPGKN